MVYLYCVFTVSLLCLYCIFTISLLYDVYCVFTVLSFLLYLFYCISFSSARSNYILFHVEDKIFRSLTFGMDGFNDLSKKWILSINALARACLGGVFISLCMFNILLYKNRRWVQYDEYRYWIYPSWCVHDDSLDVGKGCDGDRYMDTMFLFLTTLVIGASYSSPQMAHLLYIAYLVRCNLPYGRVVHTVIVPINEFCHTGILWSMEMDLRIYFSL